MSIARSAGCVLITNDPDFGELIVRQGHPHAGIIFLRRRTSLLATKIARLDFVLSQYGDRLDQLLVVTEGAVRARPT